MPTMTPELYPGGKGIRTRFFAVVTAFHLRLYPRPGVTGSSLYIYPVEYADEISSWARSISAEVDRRVELQIVTSREVPGAGLNTFPASWMASPVFADDETEGADALKLLGTRPVREGPGGGAVRAADLAGWYDAVMTNYPSGHRYATDNMWTSASAEALLPGTGASSTPCRRTRPISCGSTGGRRRSGRTWPTAPRTRSTSRSHRLAGRVR